MIDADITSNNNSDINFGGAVALNSDLVFASGNGNINFNGPLNGAHDLTLNTNGNIAFNGSVGGSAALKDVEINNAGDVTSTASFKAGHLRVANASGTADFQGAGADIAGNVDIDAQNIRGTYKGNTGRLNSNSGSILANATFDTLDISGLSADLSAGRIGMAGPANQGMANRIR
ncbi:MAG: hypothetical protein AAF280_09530, partial [Pseudomonadota bacterium]